MSYMVMLFGLLGFLLSGFYATWQVDLLNRGFSLSSLASLLAISQVLSLAIDVPTSIFSDFIGHKKAVLIGVLIYLIGFLVPALYSSPYAVAMTVICISVGDAILEGALDAWAADLRHLHSKAITNVHFMGLDQAQRIGMILGAILIPGLITVAGVSAQIGWLFYATVAMGILLFVGRMPFAARFTTTKSAKHISIFDLKGHLASGTLILILSAALLFGISDGTCQIAFWPKVKELGLTKSFGLGFIQAGMSISRLIGLELWKRSRRAESVYVPALALLGSGVFFFCFAVSHSPIFALPLWFLRIMVQSAFFSAQRALIQRLSSGSGWRATIASAVTTATQIGSILYTGFVGLMGLENVELSSRPILLIGAGFTVIAGMAFLKLGFNSTAFARKAA